MHTTVARAFSIFLVTISLSTTAANASSLFFELNGQNDHEYTHHTQIPTGFGEGEFTLELWILPDDSYPVGPTTDGTSDQLINWTDTDNEPYSNGAWWYEGNFLLDGHNNIIDFKDGTFSLQFYGGGRLRWLFGDGTWAGPGGHFSIGAYPATDTPSLLDGAWHQVTLVRRWTGATDADLELWIDGSLIDTETSPARTNMHDWWDTWPGWGAQAGWFWGAEKQAAIGHLQQYEDYKGLLDELRFWSRAKTPIEIASNYNDPVTGSEPGLVAWFQLSEGSGTTVCDSLDPTLCMDILNAESSIWSTANAPIAGNNDTPTTNTWGLTVMILALMTTATLIVTKRPRTIR